MTETTTVAQAADLFAPGSDGAGGADSPDDTKYKRVPPGCEVYEINGPFFFGVADLLQDSLRQLERPPAVFILRMRHVPAVDATGLNALASFARQCGRQGTELVLSGVREQPRDAIAKMGLDEIIGRENITSHIDLALARAEAILAALPPGRLHGHRGRPHHHEGAPA